MELNREQIIKALECCTVGIGTECEKCPYMRTAYCNDVLKKDILSYIKELTQANEQLSESYDHLEKTKDELLAERSRLTEHNAQILQFGEEWEALARKFEAENKKLTVENERLKNRCVAKVILTSKDAEKIKKECIERVKLDIKAIQTNTVRKMQERLKTKSKVRINTIFGKCLMLTAEDIDQIAKEMLEGEE